MANERTVDVGNGIAATVYEDGTVVFWNITTGQGTGKMAHTGDEAADIGNGYAVAIDANGSFSPAWNIDNPDAGPGVPPSPPGGGDATGRTEAPTAAPAAGAPGASREGMPGDDTKSRVGPGRYPTSMPGQVVRKGDKGQEGIGFGSTVAPSTWNPRSSSRSEGWGTIGAGTAGVQYGYGTDWNRPKENIKLYEPDLPHLFNDRIAPGYIPGSATYNQYDLSEANAKPRFEGAPRGLFQTLKGPDGKDEVVNSRFGLGGTGDPTTGGEYQTARRYITGNAADSGTSLKGDDQWRREGRGGGAGLMGAVSPYMAGMPVGGGGAPGAGGGESNNGNAAHFFGTSVTSNWGQTQETAGLDFIATNFLRPDTPTGIGTVAQSAPASMWQALANEIKSGRIWVTNPMAWQMLQEHGYTPQNIGGSATGGQNVQPSGQTGTGTADPNKPSDQFGVSGTFKEGESTPFGNIKGGLPGGFGYEWNRLLVEKGLDERELSLKEKQELFDEAYKNTQLAQAQQKLDADIANAKEQIRVKEAEIASIAATGDKDRLQREQENLRLMKQQADELEQRKGESLGMVDGKATLESQIATGQINGQNTVEMQKFLAEQQQLAYERAANPARAFENELARGATGWNAPMQGPWGTTVGAPSGALALGQGAATQAQGMPSYNYGQPISYGYPGQVTGQPLPGDPAQAAAQAQTAQAPATDWSTGQPAAAGAQQAGAAEAQASAATQQGYDQAGQAADQAAIPQDQTGGAQAPQQGGDQTGAFQQSAVPGYGAPAPNYGYGSQGAAGLGQPDLNTAPVRTAAAVNAFKQGAAMPTAGQYGTQSTLETAQNAAVTGRQVRTQNLKQSRRMAPVARAVVGSFAKAGGVDEDTFKFYGEKGTPKATQSAGSYSIK